jgi:hypothetical protein
MDYLCILYYTTLALNVSGAICTHHQEHKLQSTAVVTHDCYGVLDVGRSIGVGCGWDTTHDKYSGTSEQRSEALVRAVTCSVCRLLMEFLSNVI